jgi:lysophospholipase L1-like esterase
MRKPIAALAVSALLSALGLEAVLRLLYDLPPDWLEPQTRHLRSPLLGWVLPPNSRSFTIDAPVQVNSHGLRDDEIPLRKPPGETRILCLGDSFTFALGVRFEDLYVQKLERMLNERHGPRRFQVINAGVAGYNTRQELIYLLAEGFKFEPDLITIGFYWNDLIGNEPPLPDIASTPVRGDGLPIYERDGGHAIPPWLRNRLRQSLILYLGVTRTENALLALRSPTTETERVQRAILKGDSETLRPFWAATRLRLAEIAAEAKRMGIPLLLVAFPMENEIRRERNPASLSGELAKITQDIGIQFVALEPEFRAALSSGTNPFLSYDLHPNPLGMQIAADAIYRAIADRWLLDPTK